MFVLVIFPLFVSFEPFAIIPIPYVPSIVIVPVPVFMTLALAFVPDLIPTLNACDVGVPSAIVESILIFPEFVMSLAIFTYAPREFSTSLRFIVPLFSTFPVPKLTPPVTEPSAIKANAAD